MATVSIPLPASQQPPATTTQRHDVNDADLWRRYAVHRKALWEVAQEVGMSESGVQRRLSRAFPREYRAISGPRRGKPLRGAPALWGHKPGVTAVWRAFSEGLPVKAVARRFGVSRDAVLARLRRHPDYPKELRRRLADPTVLMLSRRFAEAELKRIGKWRRG